MSTPQTNTPSAKASLSAKATDFVPGANKNATPFTPSAAPFTPMGQQPMYNSPNPARYNNPQGYKTPNPRYYPNQPQPPQNFYPAGPPYNARPRPVYSYPQSPQDQHYMPVHQIPHHMQPHHHMHPAQHQQHMAPPSPHVAPMMPSSAVPMVPVAAVTPQQSKPDIAARLQEVQSKLADVQIKKEEAIAVLSPLVNAALAKASVPEMTLDSNTTTEAPKAKVVSTMDVEAEDEEDFDDEDDIEEDEEEYEPISVVYEDKAIFTLEEMRTIFSQMKYSYDNDIRVHNHFEKNETLEKALAMLPETTSSKGTCSTVIGKRFDSKNSKQIMRSSKTPRTGGRRKYPPGQEPLDIEIKPLEQTENRYIINRDVQGDEKKIRQVKLILNKLSEDNLLKLVQAVKDLNINSEELMNEIVGVVFEKAISEPHFSSVYANFCRELKSVSYKVENVSMADRLKQVQSNDGAFRKMILTKSQSTFEGYKFDNTSEDEFLKLTPEEQAAISLSRKSYFGAIRFFGELYQVSMLASKIMYICFTHLFTNAEINEDAMEALCKLITTVGKRIDEKESVLLEPHMERLKLYSKDKKFSSRMRFLMMDVIELRQNNWVPRSAIVAKPAAPALTKDRYSMVGKNADKDQHKQPARERDAKRNTGSKDKDAAATANEEKKKEEEDEWTSANANKGNKNKGKQENNKGGKGGKGANNKKNDRERKEAPKPVVKAVVPEVAPKAAPRQTSAFGALMSDDDDDDEVEDVETPEVDADVDAVEADQDVNLDDDLPEGPAGIITPNEKVAKQVESTVKEFFNIKDKSEVKYYIGQTSAIDAESLFAWISVGVITTLEAKVEERDAYIALLPQLSEGENPLPVSAYKTGFVQLMKLAGDICMDNPKFPIILASLINLLLAKNLLTFEDISQPDVMSAVETFPCADVPKFFAAIIKEQKFPAESVNQLVGLVSYAAMVDADSLKKSLTDNGVEF